MRDVSGMSLEDINKELATYGEIEPAEAPEKIKAFIKRHEGFRAKPYWDNKQWSVGYGTRAKGPNDTKTEVQADAELDTEIATLQDKIRRSGGTKGVPFTTEQVDALTSFTFNLGSESLKELTENGTRSIEQIVAKIPEYINVRDKKGNLQPNEGLKKRRAEELTMFQRQGAIGADVDIAAMSLEEIEAELATIEAPHRYNVTKENSPHSPGQRAFKRGVENTLSNVGSAVEAAGEFTGLESVAEWGKGVSEEHEALAKKYPTEIESVDDVDDLSKAVTFIYESILENIPNMIPMVAGGAIGASLKGAKYLNAAWKTVDKVINKVPKKYQAEIRKGFKADKDFDLKKTLNNLNPEAKKALASALKSDARKKGALIGAATTNYPLMVGEYYKDQIREGIAPETAGATALLAGIPGAAVDVVGVAAGLKQLLKVAHKNPKTVMETIATVAKGVGITAGVEGGTEVIQSIISFLAIKANKAEYDIFSPENAQRLKEDFFKGSAAGGGMALGGSAPIAATQYGAHKVGQGIDWAAKKLDESHQKVVNASNEIGNFTEQLNTHRDDANTDHTAYGDTIKSFVDKVKEAYSDSPKSFNEFNDALKDSLEKGAEALGKASTPEGRKAALDEMSAKATEAYSKVQKLREAAVEYSSLKTKEEKEAFVKKQSKAEDMPSFGFDEEGNNTALKEKYDAIAGDLIAVAVNKALNNSTSKVMGTTWRAFDVFESGGFEMSIPEVLIIGQNEIHEDRGKPYAAWSGQDKIEALEEEQLQLSYRAVTEGTKERKAEIETELRILKEKRGETSGALNAKLMALEKEFPDHNVGIEVAEELRDSQGELVKDHKGDPIPKSHYLSVYPTDSNNFQGVRFGEVALLRKAQVSGNKKANSLEAEQRDTEVVHIDGKNYDTIELVRLGMLKLAQERGQKMPILQPSAADVYEALVQSLEIIIRRNPEKFSDEGIRHAELLGRDLENWDNRRIWNYKTKAGDRVVDSMVSHVDEKTGVSTESKRRSTTVKSARKAFFKQTTYLQSSKFRDRDRYPDAALHAKLRDKEINKDERGDAAIELSQRYKAEREKLYYKMYQAVEEGQPLDPDDKITMVFLEEQLEKLSEVQDVNTDPEITEQVNLNTTDQARKDAALSSWDNLGYGQDLITRAEYTREEAKRLADLGPHRPGEVEKKAEAQYGTADEDVVISSRAVVGRQKLPDESHPSYALKKHINDLLDAAQSFAPQYVFHPETGKNERVSDGNPALRETHMHLATMATQMLTLDKVTQQELNIAKNDPRVVAIEDLQAKIGEITAIPNDIRTTEQSNTLASLEEKLDIIEREYRKALAVKTSSDIAEVRKYTSALHTEASTLREEANDENLQDAEEQIALNEEATRLENEALKLDQHATKLANWLNVQRENEAFGRGAEDYVTGDKSILDAVDNDTEVSQSDHKFERQWRDLILSGFRNRGHKADPNSTVSQGSSWQSVLSSVGGKMLGQHVKSFGKTAKLLGPTVVQLLKATNSKFNVMLIDNDGLQDIVNQSEMALPDDLSTILNDKQLELVRSDRGEAWLNIQKELSENAKNKKNQSAARGKRAGLLRQLRALPEYKEMQQIGRILKQNAKLRNPLVDEDVLADMTSRLAQKNKMGTTWYFKDHAVIYINNKWDAPVQMITLGHEFGHAFMRNALHKAPKEVQDALYRAYETEMGSWDKPYAYREWFADKMSAWAASGNLDSMQGLHSLLVESTDTKQSLAKKVKQLFTEIKTGLKAAYERMHKNKSKRFEQNQTFSEYMQGVTSKRYSPGYGFEQPSAYEQDSVSITEEDTSTTNPTEEELDSFTERLRETLVDAVTPEFRDRARVRINGILSGSRKVLYPLLSADQQLRLWGADAIADKLWLRPQTTSTTQRPWLVAVAQLDRQWGGAYEAVLKSMPIALRTQVLKEMQNEQLTDAEVHPKTVELRKVHRKFTEYLEANVPFFESVSNHFPRMYHTSKIEQEGQAFNEFLMQYDFVENETHADYFRNAILRDQTSLDPNVVNAPSGNTVRSRGKLMQIPNADLVEGGWLHPDPEFVLMSSVRKSIRHAEFGRLFGEVVDNGRDAPYFDAAKKLNNQIAAIPDEAARNRVKTIMQGILGQRGIDMDPQLRKYQNNIMAAENWMVLLFTAVASIPELAGPILRAKDVQGASAALHQYARTVKNRKEAYQRYRAMGFLEDTLANHAMLEVYGLDTAPSWAQTANKNLFLYNGQKWFTNMSRVMSASIAEDFIIRHGITEQNENSTQFLEELKLTPDLVNQWDKLGRPVWNRSEDMSVDLDQDPNTALLAQRIQDAIGIFVDQSVVNPNNAMRPVFMSDPRFGLLTHLKTFFYAYQHTVLEGIWNNVKQQDGLPAKSVPIALAALFMLPLAGLALELRELLQYWGKRDPTAKQGMGDYTWNIARRAGGFGALEIGLSAMDAQGWNGKTSTRLLGPTAGHIDSIFRGNGFNRTIPIWGQIPALRHLND
jgi:GH24 family phage-related lysozyme (muramidase)